MSFEFVTKLPTPTEIKEQYPVPEEIKLLMLSLANQTNFLLLSDLAQQIMKLLSLIIHQDLLRFRRRLKTKLLLFQEFTLTNQERQA